MKSNSLILKIQLTSQIVAIVSSFSMSIPAYAGPAADSFQHNTNTPNHLPTSAKIDQSQKAMVGAGAGAMFSSQTPVVAWFEKLDSMVGASLPTKQEEFVLNQNLNQELERVQAMTKVYGAISNRYKRLAKDIRSMPVQANWSGVQEYRDNRASFFEDEAEVFSDMIKPRQPAETIEDLRAQLADVNQRASGLKTEGQTLMAMDRDLRKTYSVHAPRYSDELYKYVSHKQDQPGK